MVQISRGGGSGGGRQHSHSRSKLSISRIVWTIALCGVSFYSGALSGMGGGSNCDMVNHSNHDKNSNHKDDEPKSKSQFQAAEDAKIEAIVQQRVQAELSKAGVGVGKASGRNNNHNKEIQYFPKTTSAYLNGMARIPKDDFVKKYDYGPPMEAANDKNGDVLILYNTPKALPKDETHRHMAQYNIGGGGISLLDVDPATENCDTMNVINTNNPGNTRQCLAIVGNYESYNVQRWMRLPPEKGGKLDPSHPLRPVSRGHGKNGSRQFVPPNKDNIQKHWGMLQRYFESLDSVLKELRPIAKKIAVENTIIVMTCNMGQSELLMNFVCNTRAKGLSLNNVLVFPTDEDTKELAESLGLATFYDKKNFEDMPEAEAGHYGDRAFVAMMFAKVVCVQLISHLGYDLLFQDVDMVWYKNPLEYFHDDDNPHRNFDMYFQDDGAHSTRYAPLSANSGFYYVRNNDRTRYLFTSLLYHGDQILESHSHQEALVQVMNEHSSLFGLKVKVLSRDMDEFPGGWHYHKRNKDFMMKVVKEEISPIIFHMSWTKNKDNKIKFFQQMGQWYVNEACIAHTKSEIVGNLNLTPEEQLFEPCCLAEPNIVCHYRDKPSKIPCRDVDPIDQGRPSFW